MPYRWYMRLIVVLFRPSFSFNPRKARALSFIKIWDKGATCNKHCNTEFIKHVFPWFIIPGPIRFIVNQCAYFCTIAAGNSSFLMLCVSESRFVLNVFAFGSFIIFCLHLALLLWSLLSTEKEVILAFTKPIFLRPDLFVDEILLWILFQLFCSDLWLNFDMMNEWKCVI